MVRRRRRAVASSPPPNLWIMTYGDLVTQILAFFILLFSISTLDVNKYKTALASVSANLGAASSGTGGNPVGGAILGTTSPPATREPQLTVVHKQVQEAMRKNGFAGDMEIELAEDRLLLRFPDKVLYASGRADLLPEARARLDALAPVLQDIPNIVRVEGHTDSDPIISGLFPSNWELSGARAATVVRYLTEFRGLKPEQFEFAGKGEFYPVVPNTSPENKAKNRRVDIVVLARSLR